MARSLTYFSGFKPEELLREAWEMGLTPRYATLDSALQMALTEIETLREKLARQTSLAQTEKAALVPFPKLPL